MGMHFFGWWTENEQGPADVVDFFPTLTGCPMYFRQANWLCLVFGSKSLRKRVRELAQGGNLGRNLTESLQNCCSEKSLSFPLSGTEVLTVITAVKW